MNFGPPCTWTAVCIRCLVVYVSCSEVYSVARILRLLKWCPNRTVLTAQRSNSKVYPSGSQNTSCLSNRRGFYFPSKGPRKATPWNIVIPSEIARSGSASWRYVISNVSGGHGWMQDFLVGHACGSESLANIMQPKARALLRGFGA